ncbi:nucleoside ABC transporter membrane protein [Stackebrandtia endophytica]|uniref:Nucleoside ABC transporter membrane protein n=1 Tax=Stackebrandtia endophytica TaxID=1496996 RepID=A0A543AQE0_9ACTN|nr:ABC transporter permease [Stackebrandtia endophytica]TQL74745.1 nucleoside ABC transporter membrane protein [Stackebrandtia endophytica]
MTTAYAARTRSGGWRRPVGTMVVALVLLLLGLGVPGTTTVFRLSSPAAAVALPEIALPAQATLIVLAALCVAVTVVGVHAVRRGTDPPTWGMIVTAAAAVIGFLTWAAAGEALPVVGLLGGSLALAVPLIFGSLAGVVSERAGVVNVAIEGQLLAGAFSSALLASITGEPLVGLAAAAIAGMLVSLVLAVFAVRYLVDQVIVGIVLNVLVTGLTGFFYTQILAPSSALLNSPPRLGRVAIPVLSDIPVIGPVLFNQAIVVYLMYIGVAAVAYGLFRTRWGLRLRSVGEHPRAAETVGIDVARTRYVNVALAGLIAGVGGAFFTLGNVGAFNKEMTAGAGFIALAAVIFGRWNPLRAAAAGLLFGFVSNLQNTLSVIGSPVPSEFLLMAPYAVTIIAVAGFVGRSRGPAAAGKVYERT